jgi:hypothetical protein
MVTEPYIDESPATYRCDPFKRDHGVDEVFPGHQLRRRAQALTF